MIKATEDDSRLRQFSSKIAGGENDLHTQISESLCLLNEFDSRLRQFSSKIAGGENRTRTGLPLLDFESSASTSSTTPA